MPPMHTHHAPEPRAPPAVVPPTEAVTEENIGEWIAFWKKAPRHAASDEILGRFLANVSFMIDKLQKKTCFYSAEPIRSQPMLGGQSVYVHTEARDKCKTSKCAARSIVCTK